MGATMKEKTNCEYCFNYVFDEDYDCYICEANLDEDELVRFMSDSVSCCPYFQINNEYQIVKKQM